MSNVVAFPTPDARDPQAVLANAMDTVEHIEHVIVVTKNKCGAFTLNASHMNVSDIAALAVVVQLEAQAAMRGDERG